MIEQFSDAFPCTDTDVSRLGLVDTGSNYRGWFHSSTVQYQRILMLANLAWLTQAKIEVGFIPVSKDTVFSRGLVKFI